MANASFNRLSFALIAVLAWSCSGTNSGTIGKNNIVKTQELEWIDRHTWYLPGEDGMARSYRLSTDDRRIWTDDWISFPDADAKYADAKRVFTTSQFDRFSDEGKVICRVRTSAHSLSIARGDKVEVRGFYRLRAQIQDLKLVPDMDNSPECENIVARIAEQAKVKKTELEFYFGKRLNRETGKAGFVMMKADQQYYQKWSNLVANKCLNINGRFSSKEDVALDKERVYFISNCHPNSIAYIKYLVEEGKSSEEKTVKVDGGWNDVLDNDEMTVSEYQLMSPDSLFVSQRVAYKTGDREEKKIREVYRLNEWGDLVLTREVGGVLEFEKVLYRQMFL